MRVYEISVSLIAAIIWPVLVFAALWLFRKPIGGFIARIRSVEAGGAKVKAGRTQSLTFTQVEAERIEMTANATVDMTGPLNLVASDPLKAITDAWGVVWQETLQANTRVGSERKAHGPLAATLWSIQALAETGHIDTDVANLAASLWESFRAAHQDQQASSTDAVLFINSAQILATALTRIAPTQQ